MDRVATLSEDEYKILTVIRDVNSKASVGTQHHASGDLRRELESVYQMLINTPSWESEEMIDEVTRRIYGMLY